MAAPLSLGVLAPSPAQAAPGDTTINLLDINDFHGRIDENTTKFATTIEQLRAEEGEANTLFISAGDNIGASLFASSVQGDEPTIDVLNALGLEGSAVGNHEFDQGFDDLTGRVSDRADWDYLGANVYEKGTETPALPEFATYEVDGVTVGVIGAVTQETPSLVTPDGIANLSFGDPVDAVNRVAGELTDGDESNGEADVLVAEYHEGAGEASGAGESGGLQQEIDKGGAFAKIVTQTSGEVAAIFTGHTHEGYVYDGPVPGEADATRPILQTGSYGANIGQVTLSVDSATGDVDSYEARNVPRVETEDLSYPRVAQVKQITDAALAFAAEKGNQPVGTITADITTAFTGDTRDDRASESTLGDLVANALRDGVSDFADADLGVTNPGGLRAELLFAGDTSMNPENTDGVVTFAEANAVLPFGNTVTLVDLTGAQLKQVLEQQYQTAEDGSVPSRAYLQLGLSDNVRVTTDPTAPAGERITSVYLDDEPLDLDATYKVSTLNFLAAGGDNFRAFTQGTVVDTGLLDAELFRDYFAANPGLAPDFARQQVTESGLPAVVTGGEQTSFTLSNLDLTSLGSPTNTTLTATLVEGDDETDLGDFPITDGTADVSFTAPAQIADGAYIDLVADPSGTTITVPAQSGNGGNDGKVRARVGFKTSPGQPVQGNRARIKITVRTTADDVNLNGAVYVSVKGRKRILTSFGDNHRAVVKTRFVRAGRQVVQIRYVGNRDVAQTIFKKAVTVRKTK